MATIKVPEYVRNAVRSIHPDKRQQAIKFATNEFHKYLERLDAFDDFNREVNITMSWQAVHSELQYKFL